MLGHKWVDVVSIWGILALVCEEFLKMFWSAESERIVIYVWRNSKTSKGCNDSYN
jgi:hypothetical protein